MTARFKSIVQRIRREEILRAAVNEIGHRGISAMTMEHCARAAGVAKGTLYLYFKDKDELSAAAIQWGLNGLKQELEAIASKEGPVAEKLYRMLIRQLEFFDSNRQLYRVFLEEKGRICGKPKGPVWKRLTKGRQGYVDFIIRVVSEGIASGEFRNLPGQKLGMVWVEMVGGMVVHRLTSENLAPPEADADLLIDLFLSGALKKKVAKK